MRHRKVGKKLNRTGSHRRALFRNLCIALIREERIQTTLAKAKEMRRHFEPLVTVAKEDSVARRRLVFNRLRDRSAVTKLFGELGPRFKERPGGYTRVIKCGFRAGDSAPVALIELVEAG